MLQYFYGLFSFIIEMFNFSINIINKCLFYIFKFIKEDSSRLRD